MTINVLPDNVLLHVFHFYRLACLDGLEDVDQPWDSSWRWHRLVHVCSRWRSLAFASPDILDLRLVCDPVTSTELTRIWPALPIIIRNMGTWLMPEDYDFDAAIVHHNRIREINLYLTNPQLQQLASAMQEQFPALTHLMLGYPGCYPSPAPALPDGLLGGGAPRLQSLKLESIPFPALPKILLSATDLVRLSLRNIPHSGYISPEAFVTGLAALANLESLVIGFESPLSRPDRRSPLPTRIILPALTRFNFHGVSEYLEDFVARIEAPLLDFIFITFFHQLIFDIPQLVGFMQRTRRFQALDETHVDIDHHGVEVISLPPTSGGKFGLRISCRKLDWQLSSLAQVVTTLFASVYKVEHLYIHGPRYLPAQWQDDIENMQWLEILHPFVAVKGLYVSKKFAKCIAPALQELVGERVTDFLPALESLRLEELQPSGAVWKAIVQFIGARQLFGHPVAVSR